MRIHINASSPAEVRAGPPHVRRVGRQPLSDLVELGGQPVLAGRLALLALAVLKPDRAPAAFLLAGRVHGDAVLQLEDLTAASGGGTPGPVGEDPSGCRAPGPRPRGGAGGLAAARLWDSCVMPLPSIPAFPQAGGLGSSSVPGGRYWARTSDLPVVSRLLFR